MMIITNRIPMNINITQKFSFVPAKKMSLVPLTMVTAVLDFKDFAYHHRQNHLHHHPHH